jgi:hypothetical protein
MDFAFYYVWTTYVIYILPESERFAQFVKLSQFTIIYYEVAIIHSEYMFSIL